MVAVVTFNSSGTASSGQSNVTLTPTPPFSNCLGKMVFLVVALRNDLDTINAPTGATYYLLGNSQTDLSLVVYYKNGEASEPNPSISITGANGAQSTAQIFVLDISGGTFPTVAAAGDARLGTANSRNGTTAGMNYPALTVVGGGYAIQFGARQIVSGTATAVATTSGFTQTCFNTSPAVSVTISAQLQNAATVLGNDLAANVCAITSTSDTTNLTARGLTVEMNVTQVAPINYVPQGNRIYVLP